MTGVEEKLASVAFDRWRFSVQTAMDIDQLMLVVSAYLSGWTPDLLSQLPPAVAQPVVTSTDLMARAVEASRAEVNFVGPASQYPPLREMSLTLAFAASRLRYLQAMRASAR